MKHTATTVLTLLGGGLLLVADRAWSGNPASVTPTTDVTSRFTDAEGRILTADIGFFGEPLASTDAAGNRLVVTRDANGNPISSSFPNGAVLDRSYDDRGNLLSVSERTLQGTYGFTYDDVFNHVMTVTDPLAGVATAAYDNSGNLTRVTTPEGRAYSASYTSTGGLAAVTDPLGTTVTLTLDEDHDPVGVTIGNGTTTRTSSLTRTNTGHVDTVTAPDGAVYDIDYDVMGRIVQKTLPDGRSIGYGYDAAGQLVSVTPPGRDPVEYEYNNVGLPAAVKYPAVDSGGTNQTSFTYDRSRQLTRVTRADGVEVLYVYDSAGRIISIGQPRGTYASTYDEATGRLIQLQSPDGITQDLDQNNEVLTGVRWSGGVTGTVSFAYDLKGRITTLTALGQIFTYSYSLDDEITQAGNQTLTYDAASGLLTDTLLDNVNERFAYDPFAEVTRHTVTVSGATIYDVTYGRDSRGRISEKTATIDGTTTTTVYSYDIAGRLITVTEDGTAVGAFTYDANNNRTDPSSTYDAQDRLINQGTVAFGYNAQGERTQLTDATGVTQYAYGARGALTGLTLPDGTQIQYLLDGQRRRVAKRVDGTTMEAWLYRDNGRIVARLNGVGTVTQRYVYASQPHVPDYLDASGQRYKIVTDNLGSVRLVVNATAGTIVQRIDYDAWGRITADTSPSFQPFAYAGGLHDSHSGFTHFGSREYDAASARWTSKDPVGFIGSDSNLYEYVSSDPINSIDPTGLDPLSAPKTSPIKGFRDGVKKARRGAKSRQVFIEEGVTDENIGTDFAASGRDIGEGAVGIGRGAQAVPGISGGGGPLNSAKGLFKFVVSTAKREGILTDVATEAKNIAKAAITAGEESAFINGLSEWVGLR